MSRGVKPYVEEGVEKNNVDRCSCRGGVEEQSKETRREPRSIHQVSRRCPDCDKKKLKSSTDSQVSRRCQANFVKIVFREEKNTNMNAIKHATQPMIQTPY